MSHGPPADDRIQIELIRRFAALEPYATEWNALLERSEVNGVFLTWEWISTWWAVYGAAFRLQVLLARRAGRLVGIAPLMIGRHPRYKLPRVLMMIGQRGDTLAERFAFIEEPGLESEVTSAFVAHLLGPMKRRWDMIQFARMLDGAGCRRRLTAVLENHGLDVTSSAVHRAPYARLPAAMDDYLATRSGNFRSQYRGSCRKLEQLGDVRWRYAGRDIGVAEAIEALGRLHRRRFASQSSSSFRTQSYVSFHTRLAEAFLERGWLWLVIVELDGEPIAARYDYVYGNKLWCMQGGWDPDYHAVRPGMILTGAAIRWAIEHGLPEYDFLCGEEDYKERWANAERSMSSLRAVNPHTLRGAAMAAFPLLRRANRRCSMS